MKAGTLRKRGKRWTRALPHRMANTLTDLGAAESKSLLRPALGHTKRLCAVFGANIGNSLRRGGGKQSAVTYF